MLGLCQWRKSALLCVSVCSKRWQCVQCVLLQLRLCMGARYHYTAPVRRRRLEESNKCAGGWGSRLVSPYSPNGVDSVDSVSRRGPSHGEAAVGEPIHNYVIISWTDRQTKLSHRHPRIIPSFAGWGGVFVERMRAIRVMCVEQIRCLRRLLLAPALCSSVDRGDQCTRAAAAAALKVT